MPGALDGMRHLQALGYALVVVTNQSGIARGYYSEAEFQALSTKMQACLRDAGIDLAGIFYCPHHPDGSVEAYTQVCTCRKPAPGLILDAARQLDVSLSHSLMVGDKLSDMQAAEAADVQKRFHLTNAEPYAGSVRVSSLVEVPAILSTSLQCTGVR